MTAPDPLLLPASVRRPAAVLFVVLLGAWTWKLLEPKPVPDDVVGLLSSWFRFLPYFLAKFLHAGGYAALAFLALVAAPSGRWRAWLVTLLVLHAPASEIGQTFVPNRTGKMIDACLDWTGLAAGWVVWSRFVRYTSETRVR